MKRIDTNETIRPQKPSTVVPGEFRRDVSVDVPLDFLQGIAAIAQGNLERRPPKLQLPEKAVSLAGQSPVEIDLSQTAMRGTDDISYAIADFILRRKNDIDGSNDAAAGRGLESLDRICRMFLHMYEAKINPELGGGMQ